MRKERNQSSRKMGMQSSRKSGKNPLLWEFFWESSQIWTKKDGNDLAPSLWMGFSRGGRGCPKSLQGFKGGNLGKTGKANSGWVKKMKNQSQNPVKKNPKLYFPSFNHKFHGFFPFFPKIWESEKVGASQLSNMAKIKAQKFGNFGASRCSPLWKSWNYWRLFAEFPSDKELAERILGNIPGIPGYFWIWWNSRNF